jgi:succinyl-CoA synthetase beta subunit
VAIGIASPSALATALTKMRADVAAYDRTAVSDRFLVEAMAPKPLAELIVSFRRDVQFGMAMTLGAGGVLVELLADAETLLLPVSAADIAAALARLRVTRLITGYRGGASGDLGALATMLAELAHNIATNSQRFAEVEINPLFVCENAVMIVDVLIHESSAQ